MDNKKVRVRYAPSPTGFQHIGGVRTALYNYFFARSSGGDFILRIEDTDRTRYAKEFEDDLFDTLNFLGIDYDEGPVRNKQGGFDSRGAFGPYVQSERIELYQQYAKKLVDLGKAYYCFCSPERLEEIRKTQKEAKDSSQGYDRHCANIPLDEAEKRIKNGESYTIRLRVPTTGETVFHDEILGTIKKKNKDVSPDPIILKSDGYPTYHLANVVDDHLMQITHIMRAQEWLASVPLHVIMYEAFGWEPPKFCHLPMVMGKDGQKLSKRHGSTSLKEFRAKGYLKEAIINYVSLVGWSLDGSREMFSKEELENCFDASKIHPNPAIFDYKKLDWFNGLYIRAKSDEELASMLLPYMHDAGINVTQGELLKFIPLIKERLRTLADAPDMLRFLFMSEKDYDSTLTDKNKFLSKNETIEDAIKYLDLAETKIKACKDVEKVEEVEQDLSAYAKESNIKLNDVFMPIRVAITTSPVSPPLFASIKLLGLKTTLSRIEKSIKFLKA